MPAEAGGAADTAAPAPLAELQRRTTERIALAPVHAATHAALEHIEPGTVRARMPLPTDGAPVESVLVLADFVTGLAVTGTLAAGERIVTLALGLQMYSRPTPGDTVLHGTGRLDHAGDRVSVSSAEIVDGEGRPVARATGRNAVLADASGDTLADTPPRWAPFPAAWDVLVRIVAPGPDEEEVDEGPVVVTARPDPTTANSAGVVQGGVLGGIAVRGLTTAVGMEPDEVHCDFVRAAPADGAVLSGHAVAEHTGRRMRSGRAAVHDVERRLLVSAAGMAYRP